MKGFRFRLPRTFLFIIGGVTVLGGGSGVAAVVIGADKLLGPSYSDVNGLGCTTVETVVIRKADRYWIRKYVTTDEPADGPARLRTALRVARKVQQAEHSDLVQVTVLDKAGPTERARMRGRAIGAQVVYIPDLAKVPEGTAVQPVSAYYVEGSASAAGEFWGMRIDIPREDSQALSAALTDDADCAEPVVEGQEAHGASGGHGNGAAHGKAAGHGEAADQDDAHGGGHGSPAAHDDRTPLAEQQSKETFGLLASLMGMVGLGGEPAADTLGTRSATGDDLPPDDHAEPGEAVTERDGETVRRADAAPQGAHTEEAAGEKGWFDSVKGMVGLGERADAPEAKTELPGAGAEASRLPVETGPEHGAGKDQAVPATSEPDDHGAAWLAKMRAQPLTPEGSATPPAEERAVRGRNEGTDAAHKPAEEAGSGGSAVHAEASQAVVAAEDDDPEKHRRKPVPVETH